MPERALSAAQVTAIKTNGNHLVAPSLYLQIRPQGTRSWLFRYARQGRTCWMGLGALADVPLTKARAEAERLRVAVREGQDPLAQRRATKAAAAPVPVSAMPSFKQCAADYIRAQESGWSNAKHAWQWTRSLEMYAYPTFGDLPVNQVTVEHVLKALQPIWTSLPETAGRVRGRMEKIMGWAEAMKFRSGANPARWTGGALSHMLPPLSRVQEVVHHPAVPYRELPKVMADLRRIGTNSSAALQFLILTASRSGEVRGARWSEVNLASRLWIVPKERMKTRQEHRVPLSDAAVALLESMPRGEHDLIFCGSKPGQPMSDMTMLKTLRTLRDDRATIHGCRSSFRDWCAEATEFPREIVEQCLAHTIGSEVEQAYLRSDHLAKRAIIMAEWASYLV